MRVVCRMHIGFDELRSACRNIAGLELVHAHDHAEVLRGLEDADGLIIFAGHYGAGVAGAVAAARRLRWLHFTTAGVDPLWAWPPPAQLAISSGGAAWSAPVAEHAVALLLALLRGLPQAERDRQAARWQRPESIARIAALRTRRVLLLGYGAIGRQIARRLRGFDVRLIALARRARDQDGVRVEPLERLPALLPDSDALVLALPLTPTTRHLIDEQALALLPRGAALVNVSRGAVLDENALVAALRRGHCVAALDVFSEEPLPPEHPLWRLDNVLITPHVAGFGDPATLGDIARICHDNLLDLLAGRPLRDALGPDQVPQRAATGPADDTPA